jgi:hypothetical protein
LYFPVHGGFSISEFVKARQLGFALSAGIYILGGEETFFEALFRGFR